jgi:hypothetical protein
MEQLVVARAEVVPRFAGVVRKRRFFPVIAVTEAVGNSLAEGSLSSPPST